MNVEYFEAGMQSAKGSFTNYVDSMVEGDHEMSTSLNKYHNCFQVKLSTRGEEGKNPKKQSM